MLRAWQAACADRAYQQYMAGQQHFLCLATPGAGKTIMAAEIAARLLSEKHIDAVLCFSPSVTIANGIRTTFSHRLNCSFSGGLGELGASLTYQSLAHFTDGLWQSLGKLRLLIVFDEIHHCAGGEEPNAWGSAIIARLQQYARFTLALTGTPWRSNATPIALAAYSKEGQIHRDFTYGMAEAISDGFCRRPNIVLVDNDALMLTRANGKKESFESVSDFIEGSGVPYQALLSSKSVMRHVLELASHRLRDIRQQSPDAAGLVVAASVQHAESIAELLRRQFKQESVVVTYRHDKAAETIEAFRHQSTPWIVSVGMISEGTDIPRLQVCCHLSRVKTELHFRQVLGRILRKRSEHDTDAWLYTLAESNLTRFAEQLAVDVPECHLLFERQQPHCDILDTSEGTLIKHRSLEKGSIDKWDTHGDVSIEQGTESLTACSQAALQELLVLGHFKQRVLAHFL
ncbi:DEAD/DEAH box helicase family protein [Enterovibrio sp. Hal110]